MAVKPDVVAPGNRIISLEAADRICWPTIPPITSPGPARMRISA